MIRRPSLAELLVLTFILAMAACATVSAPAKLVCGAAVKPFTAEQQTQIAVEIDRLQPDDPLIPMTQDWVRMRDDVRACQAATP